MRIVTLSDEDYSSILSALNNYDRDLAWIFRQSARSEERVTNFPYFPQGGVVETSAYVARVAPPPSPLPATSPLASEWLHHVADTETPPPVSKPANRDMWGKVRGT